MAKLFLFDACPAAGGGVHSWIMRAAWAYRGNKLTAAEAERLILDNMTRDPNPNNEVAEAVNKVFGTQLVVYKSRKNSPAPEKWPEPNPEQIEAVAASGLGVADLWEASPIRFDSDEPRTAEILERLFSDDPWLCVGSKYQFFSQHLSLFKGAAYAFEQIIPSPMLSKYGKTKDGKLSQRTLDATGPRRFLVIEGDGTTKDQQAAVLLHLAERAPLSLVVDSGGKSLHGWFFVAGKNDDQLAPFFRRACTLGADKMLWTRSQFVRMPDGTRDTGKRQNILFFNPETITR